MGVIIHSQCALGCEPARGRLCDPRSLWQQITEGTWHSWLSGAYRSVKAEAAGAVAREQRKPEGQGGSCRPLRKSS